MQSFQSWKVWCRIRCSNLNKKCPSPGGCRSRALKWRSCGIPDFRFSGGRMASPYCRSKETSGMSCSRFDGHQVWVFGLPLFRQTSPAYPWTAPSKASTGSPLS
jgi:hypothetical protein